jgi:2-methylisocitrate lyase-like PEP mutase family enzyme
VTVTGRAATLRRLHGGPGLLLLPNAWDAASARAFARLGYPALATTSGGVAESLGYADGEATPAPEMLAAVGRIVDAVDVPVTADLEAGYGLDAAELVERVRRAGAAGVNLEDSDPRSQALVEPAVQAERLAAVHAAGPELVLNARVDVFLRGGTLDDAVARGRTYLAAGADCVYPIGLEDLDLVAAFTRAVPGPVNVHVRPGWLPLERLAELGVRRASFGTSLHRTALAAATEVAASARATP